MALLLLLNLAAHDLLQNLFFLDLYGKSLSHCVHLFGLVVYCDILFWYACICWKDVLQGSEQNLPFVVDTGLLHSGCVQIFIKIFSSLNIKVDKKQNFCNNITNDSF